MIPNKKKIVENRSLSYLTRVQLGYIKGGFRLKKIIAKFIRLISHQNFRKVLVIYILFNLGVLFTIFGTVLYSPALVPDVDNLTPEDARMEIENLTKGALIAQNFEINQYNIGFDMINIGGIFLIISILFYNNVEEIESSNVKNRRLKVYRLRNNGHLRGNILEWLCLIVFFFSFFTFLYNIFVYVIILSFIVGIIGFAIRKLNMVDLLSHQYQDVN